MPASEIRLDQPRGRAVRAVDVEPQALAVAQVGEIVERIDGAGAGRAGRADDAERRQPDLAVDVQRGVDRGGLEPVVGVGAQHAQVGRVEAEHAPRLQDRAVRVLGDVARWTGRARRRDAARAAASAVSVPTEPPLTRIPSVSAGIPIQSRIQSSTASSSADAPDAAGPAPGEHVVAGADQVREHADRVARASRSGRRTAGDRDVGRAAGCCRTARRSPARGSVGPSGHGRMRCRAPARGRAARSAAGRRGPPSDRPAGPTPRCPRRRRSSGSRLNGSTAATIGRCAPP